MGTPFFPEDQYSQSQCTALNQNQIGCNETAQIDITAGNLFEM